VYTVYMSLLHLLGKKNVYQVLRYMDRGGFHRFGEIQNRVGLSPKITAAILKEVVACELATKTTETYGFRYTITPRGSYVVALAQELEELE